MKTWIIITFPSEEKNIIHQNLRSSKIMNIWIYRSLSNLFEDFVKQEKVIYLVSRIYQCECACCFLLFCLIYIFKIAFQLFLTFLKNRCIFCSDWSFHYYNGNTQILSLYVDNSKGLNRSLSLQSEIVDYCLQ